MARKKFDVLDRSRDRLSFAWRCLHLRQVLIRRLRHLLQLSSPLFVFPQVSFEVAPFFEKHNMSSRSHLSALTTSVRTGNGNAPIRRMCNPLVSTSFDCEDRCRALGNNTPDCGHQEWHSSGASVLIPALSSCREDHCHKSVRGEHSPELTLTFTVTSIEASCWRD